jgi:hypothetical protein
MSWRPDPSGRRQSAPSPINWQGQRYSTHQW